MWTDFHLNKELMTKQHFSFTSMHFLFFLCMCFRESGYEEGNTMRKRKILLLLPKQRMKRKEKSNRISAKSSQCWQSYAMIYSSLWCSIYNNKENVMQFIANMWANCKKKKKMENEDTKVYILLWFYSSFHQLKKWQNGKTFCIQIKINLCI